MGTRIHGITVTLYDQVQTDLDGFGRPVYSETPVSVENVLVGNPSTEEITDVLNLTGKRIVYMLGIPKDDTHVWEDRKVVLPAPFSGTFHTIQFETTGIQDLIPLDWGRNIAVERFDG